MSKAEELRDMIVAAIDHSGPSALFRTLSEIVEASAPDDGSAFEDCEDDKKERLVFGLRELASEASDI